MGNIASKLISTKKQLEQTNLMDTKVFSGYGNDAGSETNDPVSRLRSLVQEKYAIEAKQEKKHKLKHQTGGLIPLLPIGIAIASALGSKLVGDLYDFVKKILTGGNYKFPNKKNNKEKLLLLQDFINNIK